MGRLATIALASTILALAACGDSDGGTGTATTPAPATPSPSATTRVPAGPIGAGAACHDRLARAVTVDFLRQRGIGIANAQAAQSQLSSAIAKVCQEGPASKAVADAAERVVQVINAEFIPQ